MATDRPPAGRAARPAVLDAGWGGGMSEVHLLFGDCLEILPTLPDKSVDAIITDLPYGTTACKWDVIIPLDAMWREVKRICKGAFATTASQPFTSVLVCSNLEWFKHEWIWQKNVGSNFLNLKYAPMKEHENVLVFSRNGYTYNPIKIPTAPSTRERAKYSFASSDLGSKPIAVYGGFTKGKPINHGQYERHPRSVVSFKREMGEHPTQKPVALYEYLIRTYTNEGDTVLDFCMGSGTTLVACVNTNRNGIGIEKERDYFAIAEKRIAAAQQQMVMPL